MEFNKVNFSVIKECFEGCDSKETIFSIFQASACYVLDAELKVLKPDTLPPSLRNLTQSLSITNEKALVLILSLHALLKEYIAVGMNDENEIA